MLIRYEYYDDGWKGLYSLCYVLYEKHYVSKVKVPDIVIAKDDRFWFKKEGNKVAKKEVKLLVKEAKKQGYEVRRLVADYEDQVVVYEDNQQVVVKDK